MEPHRTDTGDPIGLTRRTADGQAEGRRHAFASLRRVGVDGDDEHARRTPVPSDAGILVVQRHEPLQIGGVK